MPAAEPKAIQLHNAYLVLETIDGMLVIDQHALHERVLFEQLKERFGQGELESQRLLIPEPVELNPDQAAKALFKELGYANAVWITLLSLPRICRAALEAIRMTKRWPWVPPGSFLDRPIADLRREFGIRVV